MPRTMRPASLVLILALLAWLLPACAGPAVRKEPVRPVDPRSVVVLRGADGSAVSWDQLVSDAARADAVLIGETHGHPLGLASAAALWADVLARSDGGALALEFFERDEQAHVDDYLGGLTDEKTFKESTRRTAGNYPDGHRAMLEAAKADQRPVIASNAPRVYVRAARKDGFDRLQELAPEQRRLFRIPDALPTGRYREDFDKLMGGMPAHAPSAAATKPGAGPTHAAPEESAEQLKARLDASFRSQSLWDWTMAESVARALDAGAGPVTQVVGRFHVEFDGGLVQALRTMRPGTRTLTVVYIDESSAGLRPEDRGRADYVIYVGPAPEEEQTTARR